MKAYYYIARLQIILNIAYRFEVFVSLGTNFIIMVASVFLWKTIYSGIDLVETVNVKQMITYAIISTLLSSVYKYSVQSKLNQKIREGTITSDFLKPINPLMFWLFGT